MRKYRLGILLLFAFIVLSSGLWLNSSQKIKLTKGMFCCDSPKANGKIKLIINKAIYVPYSEKKLMIKAHHPLARYFVFYKISMPDKKAYWLCPQMRLNGIKNRQVQIKIVPQQLPWRYWIFGISVLIILLSGGGYFYLRKKAPSVLNRLDFVRDCLSVSIIYAVCSLSLVILLILSDNIITAAADDPGYFQTASDMLNLNFKGPWRFTIGTGFWYMPFIMLLKAGEFYDIALQFANFCGFVLAPGTMILIYFIIKKLSFSRLKALITVMLLVLFPFFYHYLQDWNTVFFKSYFASPSYLFDMRNYNILIMRGYNCMSDTPSNFVMMLSVMLILYLPAKIKYAVLVSFIFGFACLIRINNILFSPLIAWLFWARFSEKDIKFEYIIKVALACISAFFIAFLPQLIINHLHFGSVLTFPYVLHNNEAAKGFKWAVLDLGINFMGGANFAIWATGLSGMIFIEKRILRNTLILWAIPVILFFFGYSCIGTDARRFIIGSFGAMLAAFVCLELWGKMELRYKFIVWTAIVISLLFVTPTGYTYTGHLPFDLQKYSWGSELISIMGIIAAVVIILSIWLLRRQKRSMFLMICFGILFYSGSVYLLASVMLLILFWGLIDWGMDVWKIISKEGFFNYARGRSN